MKTAIITGASRGIGKATALSLASNYEYIAICSRNSESDLLSVKDSILSLGCKCDAFLGDVSDYNFVSDMVSRVIATTGEINVLINNAGISTVGLFTDMSPSQWNEIISTNLTSVYNTCHCVVPHMVHTKSGHIINVSSVWGLSGASCEVAYSATKGAINSFTKALAKELAPSNIAVNAVAFGAIDTSMNGHLSEDELSSLSEEIPAGRLGTPEEAACCISNLLTMPTYLTGEVIKFDGGWI
ncbi:MAG: SDR family NAD(P)-dependent oxidoreductase [Lachnospiraceae bacterium]|nr:SDR family NAD(P)-dependent oxidoreductase [Lachnospiraceae bacterium]